VIDDPGLKAEALAFADYTLARCEPERRGLLRDPGWRLSRPSARMLIASGYAAGSARPIPVRGTVVCITRDELAGVFREILDGYHAADPHILVAGRSLSPGTLAQVVMSRLREKRLAGVPDEQASGR
jgi:hypothetical protein